MELPQSSKATWMRQTLGWTVDAIDLHRFGWSARAQMEAVMDAVTTDSSYDALIGSSFGGLAVANAASRLRDHPLHLVLLAPAFGHPDLIRADLGPEVMAMWERTGYHRFEPVGWEAPIDLPWSFMAEERISIGLISFTPQASSMDDRMLSYHTRTPSAPWPDPRSRR